MTAPYIWIGIPLVVSVLMMGFTTPAQGDPFGHYFDHPGVGVFGSDHTHRNSDKVW